MTLYPPELRAGPKQKAEEYSLSKASSVVKNFVGFWNRDSLENRRSEKNGITEKILQLMLTENFVQLF